MLRTALCCVALALSAVGNSQQFIEVTNPHNLYQSLEVGLFGNGLSFYDVDRDGWDDLLFCSVNGVQFYKNVEGQFEFVEDHPFPLTGVGEVKQALFFDFDNDGDDDVFISAYSGSPRLLENTGTSDALAYQDISEEAGIPSVEGAECYGVSCGDYDKDGWLDVFVSNYSWNLGITNWLLHNEGDGTFTETGGALGVTTTEVPTFQTCFTDINNDGWPDIYVVNDRYPTNELYINTGFGTFTDYSSFSESDLSVCGMSNSITDFNNDGLLDIFVSNTPSGSFLLQNDGQTHFVDVSDELNASANTFCWSALWIDSNNDMFDDLYICTESVIFDNQNLFLKNNYPNPFSVTAALNPAELDQISSFTAAKGDFNNDGSYDIAVIHAPTLNVSLYQNAGGDNHYIKLDLEGTASNANATGTWIKAYMGDDQKHIYTSRGDNFMVQNSGSTIVSCGSHETIDSLIIDWPNGLTEKYFDVISNQHLQLVEGSTWESHISLADGVNLCVNEQVTLDAGEGNSFLWNTNETTQSIIVTAGGSYSVEKENVYGFSEILTTEVIDSIGLSLNTIGIHNPCFSGADGVIICQVIEAGSSLFSLNWDSGDQGILLTNLSSGIYSYTALDQNGCSDSGTVSITEPPEIYLDVAVYEPQCFDEQGSFITDIEGGVPPYFISCPSPCNVTADEHTFWLIDQAGCYIDSTFIVGQPEMLEAEITSQVAVGDLPGSAVVESFGGTFPYTFEWSNGSLSDQSGELDQGPHHVTIQDANGCTLTIDFLIDWVQSLGQDVDLAFTLSPNPFDEELALTYENLANPLSFVILDAQGRSIFAGKTSHAGKTQISTSDWGAGMYFLIWDEAKAQGTKILKK